ncbi:MAG: UDP-N-acetylmuramate--L-alanine ligase [Gammaproteobacteria bacterium]|nr:UDP-N-acetylmuramate--L-alanine ligase [Gammaproteobacteria bacterium]
MSINVFQKKWAKEHIHFIGIGGVGMSALAELFLLQGIKVSGTDASFSEATRRLQSLGAVISQGHAKENICGATVVVYTSAIRSDNPELKEAIKQGCRILKRGEMLSYLAEEKRELVVAGSHGKTGTSGMLAHILRQSGMGPSFAIGGRFCQTGLNAAWGEGDAFVAEGDESDGSFLHLKPEMVGITNLDADHLCNYQESFSNLRDAFVRFMNSVPEKGYVVVGGDDPELNSLLHKIQRPTLAVGFSEASDIRAVEYRVEQGRACFSICVRGEVLPIPFSLPIFGAFNVRNALVAAAMAHLYGVEWQAIANALKIYGGMKRRLERYGRRSIAGKSVLLFDDYGHHPSEIRATLVALREAYPNRRIVQIYQPHRYTRTQALFNDFVPALALADVLILLPIYAASESPIPGVSSSTLGEALRENGHVVAEASDLASSEMALSNFLENDDVLLVQGAGDVSELTGVFSQKESLTEAC